MADLSKRNAGAASKSETAKKPYHGPTLETYGNARDLTKTTPGAVTVDNNFDGATDGLDGNAAS